MLLTAQRPITNFHPVEASGWDSAQSFFLGEVRTRMERRDRRVPRPYSFAPAESDDSPAPPTIR
jgi:hypothetical protein